MRASSHRRAVLPILGLVLLLTAVSCSSGSKSASGAGGHGASGSGSGAAATTTTTLPPVAVTGSPVDGATNVPLDSAVVVKATGGTLRTVAVTPVGAVTTGATVPSTSTTVAGATVPSSATTTPVSTTPGAVPGGLSSDQTTWLGGTSLLPNTTYQVAATANGPGHRLTLKIWKFTTLTPTDTLHTSLNVFNGSTYGVGMPIVITLNHAVEPSLRATIEKHITVTTSNGTTGAFHWFTNDSLHWRPGPANYWPAGTKVTVTVDFKGVNAGNGVWGVDGRSVSFAIGDSHVSLVDAVTHEMTVMTNGVVVKTIPVSTGRDALPTKSGIHVVMTREQSHFMDSSTVGIPDTGPGGYKETVLWAERISNSGEFVHAAPWSVGDQGSSNVSHGCVNVSTADGEWFYDYSQIGDVVNVINTPESLAPDNGYGDWQIPWSQWAD